MYIIEAVLTRSTAAPESWPSATLVQEVFWPLARSEERLEHLRARVRDEAIDLVLFVLSADSGRAVQDARRLCERVSRTAPVLAGWTLTHCELFDPAELSRRSPAVGEFPYPIPRNPPNDPQSGGTVDGHFEDL